VNRGKLSGEDVKLSVESGQDCESLPSGSLLDALIQIVDYVPKHFLRAATSAGVIQPPAVCNPGAAGLVPINYALTHADFRSCLADDLADPPGGSPENVIRSSSRCSTIGYHVSHHKLTLGPLR
jgi:hypothetical protein